MVVVTKGSVSVDFGIVKLTGDLSDDDRQIAWELFTEMSTRVAVTGKLGRRKFNNFDGEIYIESLESLYKFFQETRKIMRSFPVGKLDKNNNNNLGKVINKIMIKVLRPFLEKWQGRYRYWWEYQSDIKLPPFERQATYPNREDFLNDWGELRKVMKRFQQNLGRTYKLV